MELAAITTRLISHYWTANDDPRMRQAQIEDWIDDLIEFDVPVVTQVCQEWRRTQTRRPLPADIRRMCIELQCQQQVRLAAASPIDMDAYARSVGFASNAERMEAIRADQERRRRRENADLREFHELRAGRTALGVGE